MNEIILNLGRNSKYIILFIIFFIGIYLLVNLSLYVHHKFSHYNKEDHVVVDAFLHDQSQNYILIRKKDYKVLFISLGIEDLFHIEKSRIELDLQVLQKIVERQVYRDFLERYQAWDREKAFHYDFQLKNQPKWFILTITSLQQGKYELVAFLDNTENKEREKNYQKQIEKSNEESEYKSSFLSKMSHEIRTPMNGITGMLTLAKQTINKDTKEAYYIDQAEDISKYLLSLINEVLDMSRMEAGKLELEEKPFNIYDLKTQLNNMFKENIEKKEVVFNIEYYDFDTKYFIGDELRIMQILINLVSNAAKFTEHGEIKITFKQMYKAENEVNIMMRVHDTGKGMSNEFLSHIFRPFVQEGVDISRKYGGSGLGMAITDQLVKLMGGEIIVDSLVDKGSDFTVFLNLPIALEHENVKEVEEIQDVQYSFAGKHILLAEDNEINAEICVSVLESKGASIERVENGKEAVEAMNKNESNYDFILMDIQMPEMDGYEATKVIRQTNKEIPIFALSADAYLENKRYSKEIGMDGHFSKPIDFEKMEEDLGKFYARRKK